MLGGEKVWFLILPVLPPALLKGCGLALLRKPGDEVGMAGGGALLSKRLSHDGDEAQEGETGVNVAGTVTIVQAVTEYLADAKARELSDATLAVTLIEAVRGFPTSLKMAAIESA
jgi:hypothetical protein